VKSWGYKFIVVLALMVVLCYSRLHRTAVIEPLIIKRKVKHQCKQKIKDNGYRMLSMWAYMCYSYKLRVQLLDPTE